VYFALAIIYIALEIFFIADVIRNKALSGAGKALWILALLVVPVLSWIVYGFWRMRQSRGF
jgi:Phospholipase_D-nuclease N-terminal